MASVNKAMILGYLGKDVELKQGQTMSFANMSVATDESYMDATGNKVKRTEWHRVIAYGKTAELCAKYLIKGSAVFVEGSLQTRKWQDRDGVERYTTEIKAQRVQFLDRKEERDNAPAKEPLQEEEYDTVPF